MVVSSFWLKLIVRGNKAEQPRPASANARMPSEELDFGTQALATKAAAITSGKNRQTIFSGTHFSMAAKRMRPAVTMPQNVANEIDASDALALKWFFMKSAAQLPFMVSQTP